MRRLNFLLKSNRLSLPADPLADVLAGCYRSLLAQLDTDTQIGQKTTEEWDCHKCGNTGWKVDLEAKEIMGTGAAEDAKISKPKTSRG